MKTLPVLIIAHEPLLALGMQAFLRGRMKVEQCRVAASLQEARELLARETVSLITIVACAHHEELPGLVHGLHRAHPRVPMVVVANAFSQEHLRRLPGEGALGLLLTVDAGDDLSRAMQAALAGEMHFGRHLHEAMMQLLHPSVSTVGTSTVREKLRTLSARELEVFQLIGAQLSTKEIASRVGISVKTVETHKRRIKDKLGLRSGAQLHLAATQCA